MGSLALDADEQVLAAGGASAAPRPARLVVACFATRKPEWTSTWPASADLGLQPGRWPCNGVAYQDPPAKIG